MTSPRPTLSTYLAFATQAAGSRLLLAACLSVALGLVEGVGLLFLVPLLGLVGIDLGAGPANHVASTIGGALGAVGLAPTLPVVLAVFVGVSVLQALILMADSLTKVRLETAIVSRLRNDLYDAILHADWLYLTRQRGSDLAHRLTTEIDRSGAIVNQTIALLAGSTQVLVALLVAARLSPAATGAVTVSSLLLLALMRARSARSRSLGTRYAEESSRLFGVLTDGLAAARTIKSVGAEGRSAGLVAASQRRLVDTWYEAVKNHVHGKAALDVLSVSGLALVVYLAVEVFVLPAGALLVLLFIFARTVPRVIGLQHSAQMVLHALPSAERVFELLAGVRAAAEPGTEASPRLLGEALRLEHVSFAYEEGRRALDRVSIEVPARRITALVGPSGAGKSTAADLALGLLTPTAGVVTVDRVALSPATVRSWRGSVAYVSQDPFLFHDTILGNLKWAEPEASEEAIASALAMAGAADFVARLPEGLSTIVGDRGMRLSGGERQRLAIARALLRRPALLVFDEPTSALDAENEERVLETVRQIAASTAVLLVTHRATAARIADRVYVIDAGRIVESGAPADVVSALRRTTA